MSEPKDETGVGYGRPPVATRFAKGRSGNPRGRPRGSRRVLPYDAVLGRTVTIRDAGVERQVTAAEAFLLHLTRRGLEGDVASARAVAQAIEEARDKRWAVPEQTRPWRIIFGCVDVGNVNHALEPLRMARKVDRFSEAAHMMLEPWIVQAALDRLGDRRLDEAQQAMVMAVTRLPHKVRWPAWWTRYAPTTVIDEQVPPSPGSL